MWKDNHNHAATSVAVGDGLGNVREGDHDVAVAEGFEHDGISVHTVFMCIEKLMGCKRPGVNDLLPQKNPPRRRGVPTGRGWAMAQLRRGVVR